MRVNDVLIFDIWGKPCRCRVLEIRDFGTVDVQRLADGKCFRVSGLPMAGGPTTRFMDIDDIPSLGIDGD